MGRSALGLAPEWCVAGQKGFAQMMLPDSAE